jgi:rRNA maturation endonuclease Nob1
MPNDAPSDTLAQSGIPGMKWGVRKSESTSEHKALSRTKWKKGFALTNDELKTANARMELTTKYRNANIKGKKPISEMTNAELKTATDRSKREIAYGSRTLRDRLTNKKKLSELTDTELNDMAARTDLEKQYKDMHYFGKVKSPLFLDNKRLATAVERFKLKKKYKELKQEDISAGEKFVGIMLANGIKNKMKDAGVGK